ncbi:MAG: hypothetical protein CVU12_07125 [Bacteroidetes bacterium HGW-Bacteroidetes-7]|jgi:hypothetical protein|nr:MAG: hypothetical protein CVU12_07125 [Bacteroidetes bacterium HGW-Bacteroidetes-7]
MKKNFNNPDFDQYLNAAIEKEKQGANRKSRIDEIMNSVTELSLQASFETRWLNLKSALVYGFSVTIVISIGCFIGNLVDVYETTHTASVEFISFGFGNILLNI